MRRLVIVLGAVSVVLACSSRGWSQAGDGPAVERAEQPAAGVSANPLSPQAMDALVAGIAFYPDAIIEQILDAAQYPEAIHQAAQGGADDAASSAWPASVHDLNAYPDILEQLDQNATITARLALAARTQLADVWRAIDRVRLAFEEQIARQNADDTGATAGVPIAGGTGYVAYPTAGFLAGFWTAQVVGELDAWYAVTAPVVYGGANIVGPRGTTVTGVGVGGQVTVGGTTYYGGGGSASITTNNGVGVQGTGQLHGNATATDSGGSYENQAGGAFSSNTGNAGSGTHHAEGTYQTHADGSVDFSRSAETSTAGTGGSSHIEHSGSGTYTGQGDGSYQGATEVQSTRGNASVNTSLSEGQVTGTVTTEGGSHSFALGQGQTNEHLPAERTGTADPSRRMARPPSVAPSPSRFSQASPRQWRASGLTRTEAWSRPDARATFSHVPQSPARKRGGPVSPPKASFARPPSAVSVGPVASPPRAFHTPAPPSRSRPSSPGRRGGRRGRR